MIKRNIIIAPKEVGGLNIVHLSTQAKALKTAWIKRFLEGDRDCGWRQNVIMNLNKQVI